MDLELCRTAVLKEIASLRKQLQLVVEELHAHPETALQEYRASALLSGMLESEGFAVARGIGGMETAFRASAGEAGPVIAILAEMDALPELGHACGHNVIAAAAVGAGLALRRVLPSGAARVVVLGTPAEETGTGKIELIRSGCFDDIDFAMMVHPSSRRRVSKPYLGLARLAFTFLGKEAHASAYPEEGVNALDGVILTFSGVNALRQQLRQEVRVHGIVNDGGTAPNIIPGRAACRFYVRAEDQEMLFQVKRRVIACAEGAALASGCRLEVFEDDHVLSPFRENAPFADLYREQLSRMALQEDPSPTARHRGSSDIGNVSQVVPTIHPHVPIGPGLRIHTPEFAAAAASPAGIAAAVEGASAMALTGVELALSPERRKIIKNYSNN